METIHFRGTRAELKAKLQEAIDAITGQSSDPTGDAQALLRGVGIEALGIIHEAYVTKARGGTDEAGISWAPLDPKYIAYGRRHAGLPPQAHKVNGEPGTRGGKRRYMLTKAQDERWRSIFANTFHRLMQQSGGEGGPKAAAEKDAKAHAAAWAWLVLKAEGARTLIGEYGNQTVETLIDTRRMFNSLSPGEESNEDRILRTEPGAVIVGTNVVYAGKQHKRRPLWPEENAWPVRWWERLGNTLADGLRHLLSNFLKR